MSETGRNSGLERLNHQKVHSKYYSFRGNPEFFFFLNKITLHTNLLITYFTFIQHEKCYITFLMNHVFKRMYLISISFRKKETMHALWYFYC